MRYISILRGINVSGQKKILMADLKVLYEALNLTKVITYIQSGNVIFDSPEPDKSVVKSIIESAIDVQYGFQVPVDVRPAQDYKAILDNCPFEGINVETEGSKLLVTFLSAVPDAGKLAEAEGHKASSEQMVLRDQVVYLYCPDGYGRTKLSNGFLEKKLGVTATTRNWKSVAKLYALATT